VQAGVTMERSYSPVDQQKAGFIDPTEQGKEV